MSLCLDSIPGGAKRLARARAVWLAALGEALDTPGRSVAVMDVADLLEPSDLLAALATRGGTVSRPRAEPASERVPAPVLAWDRTPSASSIEVANLPDDVRPAIPDPGRCAWRRRGSTPFRAGRSP